MGQADLFPLERTVATARREYDETLTREGRALCPCCERPGRVYERAMRPVWAHALHRLYEWDVEAPGRFMDYRNEQAGGEARDHTLLAHWNLIERDPTRPGFWRITPRGREFHDGDRREHAAVRLYDNRPIGFAGPLVTFGDVLRGRARRPEPRRVAA